MNQNKQDNHAVQGMTAAREAYEYAAGREALERVGNLPADKLKGVVHLIFSLLNISEKASS